MYLLILRNSVIGRWEEFEMDLKIGREVSLPSPIRQ
jgi:hypothetical protein